MSIQWVLASATVLALSGCGFHFPKQQGLPFESVYVMAARTSTFGPEIQRLLSADKRVRVVERAEEAQVVLEILGESNEKHILSLSAAGKVREFELRYVVKYRLVGRDKRDWIGISDLVLRRSFTFNDTDLLAKESEESLLYRDMKNDALSMLKRRLAKASPPASS